MYQIAPVNKTPMAKAANAMQTTAVGSSPSTCATGEHLLLDDDELAARVALATNELSIEPMASESITQTTISC